MHASRLIKVLDEMRVELFPRTTHPSPEWPEDEKATGKFGVNRDVVEHYAVEQREILVILTKTAEATMRGHALADSLTLYATGSTARLEFLHSQSDIDMLGVLSKEMVTSPEEAANNYSQIKKMIAEGVVAGYASKGWSIDVDKIDISGYPLTILKGAALERAKSFYSQSELVGSVGKDIEAAWAGFDRASLIFESAIVWPEKPDESGASNLVDDELYGIARDIDNGKFPLTGYCLAEFIGRSGLLAKAAAVSKLGSKNREKTKKEIAKTLLSRVWTANINMLCLQVMFLRRIICDKPIGDTQILVELREPPIGKALYTIPTHMHEIGQNPRATKLKISRMLYGDREKRPGKLTDGQAKRVQDVMDNLETLRKAVTAYESGKSPPLWYRFFQLMKICREVRTATGADLSQDAMDKIKKWNRELAELLAVSSMVVRELCKDRGDYGMGPEKLHELLTDHLHGLYAR